MPQSETTTPARVLNALREDLAGVDPQDLPAMAKAHEAFEQVLESLRGQSSASAESLAAVAAGVDRGRNLLESLILNEADDVQAQLKAIQAQAEAIAAILDGNSAILDGNASGPSGPAVVVTEGIVTNDAEGLPDELNTAPETQPSPAEPAAEPDVAEVPESWSLSEDDVPLLGEFVSESGSHLEQAEQDLLALEDNPENAEAVSSLFRAFHTIKGVAGFLNLTQVQSLAHATENLLDQARGGRLRLTGSATSIVLRALDVMKGLVADVGDAARGDRTLRPCLDVPPLCQELEAFVRDGGSAPATGAAADPAEESPAVEAESYAGPDRRRDDRRAAAGDATIKVATDRLDRLIDTVGELVIANSMVQRDLTGALRERPRLARNSGQLGKICRELQDLSMSLRMVQIGNAFRKMSRVVRDVSQKAGKRVELDIDGADTELDRNVVDALGDPLVHMVRNSLDHGIEPPADRESAGKPPVGKIRLRAYHKGGAIQIEVGDDGRGLDAERILKKARAKGVVGEEDVLAEADVYRLIFHPGLSTAEKVTDISGRGVGMDVVKRNIEALRGRIDIASTPGRGSTFTIRLPLTLAVIDGLIVRVGHEEGTGRRSGQRYILPINSVEQSLRPERAQMSTVQGRGELCLVRGELLPLIRLHQLFHVEPRTTDPSESLVVIVQDAEHRGCLLVDDLLGQEQVVIKSLGSLGESVREIRGVSGGAVLGDGTVSLILDVPSLLAIATE
jgi:two-component system chemotaxis sensor kinase CheA